MASPGPSRVVDHVLWPRTFTPWPNTLVEQKQWFSIDQNMDFTPWKVIKVGETKKTADLEYATVIIAQGQYTRLSIELFGEVNGQRTDGKVWLTPQMRQNLGPKLAQKIFDNCMVAWKEEGIHWLGTALRILTPKLYYHDKHHVVAELRKENDGTRCDTGKLKRKRPDHADNTSDLPSPRTASPAIASPAIGPLVNVSLAIRSPTISSSPPEISRINFYHSPLRQYDKPVPCRLYFRALSTNTDGQTINANSNPLRPDILLTHGSEDSISQLDGPELVAFATGLARNHVVLCFENQKTIQERSNIFTSLLDTYPSITVFGGKGKGAMAAVSACLSSKIEKLLLFRPLFSQNAPNCFDLLPSTLPKLGQHVRVLFVNVESGSSCRLEDLALVKEKMDARSWALRIEDVGKMAATWLKGDYSDFSHHGARGQMADLSARWNKDGKLIQSTLCTHSDRRDSSIGF